MADCIAANLLFVKKIRWSLLIMSLSLFTLNLTPLSSGFGIKDVTRFRHKCYKYIGCYNCAYPFGGELLYRFLCNLPADVLKVRFELYTRQNLNDPAYLHIENGKMGPNETIASSPIIPGLPLKVIIPGFISRLTPDSEFLKIKDELLKYGDYNVVLVDWTSDNSFPYEQAFANARVIGGELAFMLQLIHGNKDIEYENMHLIGHSLGAHIAGWAGERIEGLGRITGLDPAGVYFQDAPHDIRLDRTDAKFVDVIHTSGGHNVFEGYGISQPIGDVDFYPNGGERQPYCGESRIYNFWKVGQCDHTISQDYFRTSILECKFQAVLCKNFKDFTSRSCNYNNSVINEMGFHAKKIESNETDHPKFYLYTTKSHPFCNADNSPVLQDQNPKEDAIIYFFVNILSVPIKYAREITNHISLYLAESFTVMVNFS